VNIGLLLVLVSSWAVLSIIVALAVGAMAKARDAGARPVLDHSVATGRMPPPTRDGRARAAV
jgi:hypothetical protein